MHFLKIFCLSFGLLAINTIVHVQALDGEGIKGGDRTDHGKVPYQVGIRRVGETYIICGGSILDNYHVITAAHCFIDEETGQWREGSYSVTAGITELYRDDRTRWVRADIQKVYVPRSFIVSIRQNETMQFGDICVLKLAASLDLEKHQHLRSVSIPDGDHSYVGKEAIISGYGAIDIEMFEEEGKKVEGAAYSDFKLRYAKTTVFTQQSCQLKYQEKIEPLHICTQVDQRDPAQPEGVCSGDSGGPLVYNGNVLIGVLNSSPDGCVENKIPAVYARVSSYKDFIHKAVNDQDDKEILTHELDIFKY